MKNLTCVLALAVLTACQQPQVETEKERVAANKPIQASDVVSAESGSRHPESEYVLDERIPLVLRGFFEELLNVWDGAVSVVPEEIVWGGSEAYIDISGRHSGYVLEHIYQGAPHEQSASKLEAIRDFFATQGFSVVATDEAELTAYYFHRRDIICEVLGGYYENAPDDFFLKVGCALVGDNN